MKTEEEYKQHLSKLRKKRNYHRELADKYDKMMNNLESDRQTASLHVGKYVKYTPKNSDYLVEYMKVDSIEKVPRGFNLRGNGYYKSVNGICKTDVVRCYWDELSSIVDITREEYENTLKEYLSKLETFIINEPGGKWLDF